MNRRDYLKSLLALGASFTLPAAGSFPTAQASPALIDALDDLYVDSIWKEGIDLFEVTDYGTISFADFQEPQTRGDVFSLEISDLDDIDALIDFGQRSPLGCELQSVYDAVPWKTSWRMASHRNVADSRSASPSCRTTPMRAGLSG